MAEDNPGWLDRLGAPFPAYFAFVMATGILAITAQQLGHKVFGWVLYGISLLAYGLVWGCGMARLIHAPRALWHALQQHETGPTFFTISAGTAVLGSDTASFRLSPQLMLVLLALAVISWVFVTYVFLATVTEGRHKPSLEKGLSGSWLLVVVATASLAVLGSSVLRQIAAPPALVFACYFWLALSWFYYLVLASIVFYRFAFVPMSPDEITGPWWINESAAAITVLAGSKLLVQQGLALGTMPLHDLLAPVVGIFWVEATFWIPLLVLLFAWKYLVRARPFRYSPALWSVVFPMGMYAAATLQFRTAFGLAFLLPAARVLFWMGLLVWGIAAIGMGKRIASAIFVQPITRRDAGRSVSDAKRRCG